MVRPAHLACHEGQHGIDHTWVHGRRGLHVQVRWDGPQLDALLHQRLAVCVCACGCGCGCGCAGPRLSGVGGAASMARALPPPPGSGTLHHAAQPHAAPCMSLAWPHTRLARAPRTRPASPCAFSAASSCGCRLLALEKGAAARLLQLAAAAAAAPAASPAPCAAAAERREGRGDVAGGAELPSCWSRLRARRWPARCIVAVVVVAVWW